MVTEANREQVRQSLISEIKDLDMRAEWYKEESRKTQDLVAHHLQNLSEYGEALTTLTKEYNRLVAKLNRIDGNTWFRRFISKFKKERN